MFAIILRCWGPIQTCDTCMVELDGKLVRSCGMKVTPGMDVATESKRAVDARAEAFNVILGNHMLYGTVCDNNNENCTVHNTALAMKVERQEHEFKPKPYPVDMSNAFYSYDPSQCILCGRCVQACQTVQVNEMLSIGWELERPRGRWDADWRIQLCLLRTLHYGLPVQRTDGEVHAGRGGLSDLDTANDAGQDD